ncbi:MAG: PAS domain S-box protein [Nitrospirae bacterium]|nr:PAS domain S-box protein [Nitrospirota bacterium]
MAEMADKEDIAKRLAGDVTSYAGVRPVMQPSFSSGSFSTDSFETVLDNTAVAIAVISPQMELLWLNGSASVRFPLANLAEKQKCYGLFFGTDRNGVCDNCPVIASIRSGNIESSETGVCLDGLVYKKTASPIKDESGKIRYFVLTMEDATPLKAARESIIKAEKLYNDIFQKTPVSIWEEDISGLKALLKTIPAESVEDYRRYFKENPMFVLDAAQRIKVIDVNDETLQMYDAKSKDELKESLTKVFAPESYGQFQEELARIAAGETHVEMEAVNITLTGRRIDVFIRIFVPFKDIEPERMLLTIVDITEKKKAARSLMVREKAIESSINGIVIYDLEGMLTYVNKAFLQMWGYGSTEEVIGCKFSRFWRPCKTLDEMYTALSEGAQWEGELSALRKDGSEFDCRVSVNVVKDDDNSTLSYMGSFIDVTNKKVYEKQLQKLSQTVEQSPSMVVITDTAARIEYVNGKFTEVTGYSMEEIAGKTPRLLKSDFTTREEYDKLWRVITSGKEWRGEFQNKKKNGELYSEFATIFSIKDPYGNITNYLKVSEDLTEKKKLEAQLLQSQKMESIGLLAGGVAHDFNNILTAISSYVYLLKKTAGGDEAFLKFVEGIESSANRASNLTNSLLAFSRKQSIKPRAVSINELVINMKQLLSRLIGEQIRFNIALSKKDPIIKADLNQLEQMLVNFTINARDAMPDGGVLSVSTNIVEINETYMTGNDNGGMLAYAMVSVSDTGIGMDRDTQSKIFEPFFTTKPNGTGLGLSTVYGIVRQNHGNVSVYSEPGSGTTFKVYFPVVKSALEEEEKAVISIKRGSETILLAEDDTEVRVISRSVLEGAGYKVIEAVDGKDVLMKFTDHKDELQLVILDVLMPETSGKIALEEIRKLKPDMKALFISGYTHDILREKGAIEDNTNFITKPYSPTQLLGKIREELDR